MRLFRREENLQRANIGGVAAVVVIDLKTNEVMNCFQRVGICRLNPHPSTCQQLFKAVRNLSSFSFIKGTPG